MAQGRPSRGESVTENIQDYVEETFQNATELPDTGAVRDQGSSAAGVSQAQTGQTESTVPSSTPSGTTSSISPGTETALEEHLAATENMRGAAQSDETSTNTMDTTSAAIQNEARTGITDRANDELGMGNVRR